METLNKLLEVDINLVIVGLMVFFYTLEQLIKTPFKFDKRPHHLFQNILFQLTFVVFSYFLVNFQVTCIQWLNDNRVGLLYLVELPVWLKSIVSVMFYDLTSYFTHRASHKIPLLWRLHRVHHSDTTMDSSTFMRFHPLEAIFVFGMAAIASAAIFGTDVLSLLLYTMIFTFFSYTEHTNFKVPVWVDKTFGLIFVTPNMHKVHHEQDQFYTDSNFADIFILWDRMFGTFKHKPLEEIKYGLQEFEEENKQSFLYLIMSPFIKIERTGSDQLKSRKGD